MNRWWDLDAAQMSYTTILYGKDANGNDIEMERLHGDVNRIWVDYDDIPEDMVNAAIALEDKRFREHPGRGLETHHCLGCQPGDPHL